MARDRIVPHRRQDAGRQELRSVPGAPHSGKTRTSTSAEQGTVFQDSACQFRSRDRVAQSPGVALRLVPRSSSGKRLRSMERSDQQLRAGTRRVSTRQDPSLRRKRGMRTGNQSSPRCHHSFVRTPSGRGGQRFRLDHSHSRHRKGHRGVGRRLGAVRNGSVGTGSGNQQLRWGHRLQRIQRWRHMGWRGRGCACRF